MKKKLQPISKKSTSRPVIVDGDLFIANEGQSGNRVFVGLGKTINIGNYESIRAEFGRGITISDGENSRDVKRRCLEEVAEGIKEIITVAKKVLQGD